jgi:hypothetical protein
MGVGIVAVLVVAAVGTMYVLKSHADTTTTTTDTDSSTVASTDIPDTPVAMDMSNVSDASAINYRGNLCETYGFGYCINTDTMDAGAQAKERNRETARVLQFVWDGQYTTVNGLRMPEGYLKFPDRVSKCLIVPDPSGSATSNIPTVSDCASGQDGIFWGVFRDNHNHLYFANRHYSKMAGRLDVLSGWGNYNWRYRIHWYGTFGAYQRFDFK